MNIRTDTRAVSAVIGAILMFGLLVITFATYQSVWVPQENTEVESNAYLEARGDMGDLQNNLIVTGLQGAVTQTTVLTGVTYPERTFAVNPPVPGGQLLTGTPRTLTFSNVSAVGTEAANTKLYWNDTVTFQNVSTGITFLPRYNEFDGAPVVTTGESTYVVGENGIAPISGQSLISGTQIRFIAVQGTFETQGLRSTVTAVPGSTVSRSVAITGSGGPLTIRIDPPPRSTADQWVSAYQTRLTDNSNILDIANRSGSIVLTLDGSEVYRLQLAQVTVGTDLDAGVNTSPKYIIKSEGSDSVVDSGKRTSISVEVRDKFNNPVSGANVTFEITSGDGTLINNNGELTGNSTEPMPTNGDGRAGTTVRIDEIGNNVTVEARLLNESTSEPLNTSTFTVQTPNKDNPVELAGVTFEGVTGYSNGQNTVTIEFLNINVDTERTISRFRLTFYQGGDPPQSGSIGGTQFQVGGSDVSTNLQLPADQTTSFTIQFDNGKIQGGDWFIITVQYETGDTAQYFAAIPN